ncbi:MAG: MFS transporter [Gammaproteobacteria bacterium]|nr:MFS transporter [Gammaproteobacteria bacterium]MBU1722456.1 MFS transporter [Gammaproteobacteria bacterium]MBU2004955.1 MFS transporter [Gammaproteobacteria bacterium]
MSNTAYYRQLLFYGLAGLPLAILGLPLYIYLPSFYAQQTGLSLSIIAIVLLVAYFLNILAGPLVGWLNDRTQSRIGRRKLFMWLGAPLLLVGSEYLLHPAGGVDGFYLFIWLSIAGFGGTLISVPWHAWGAELTRNYHDKSALAASREIFIIIGMIIAIALPKLAATESNTAATLEWLNALLWGLMPLCLLPALIWLVERRPFMQFEHMRRMGGILSAHPAIHHLFPAWFITSFANALPASLFILFTSHVLQAPEQMEMALAVYFLSGVLGLPLWLKLARLIDKSRVWVLALCLSAVSLVWTPLLGAGDLYWFLAICALSGLAFGAEMALPASMLADVAQQMQYQGNSQTGLLFGLWNLLGKLALALAVSMTFPLLDWAGWQETANAIQTPQTLLTLALLFGGLPVLLKAFVAWRMWHFPFSEVDFHDYWGFSHANSMYSTYPSSVQRGMGQSDD